jgi:hypothetical protein
MFPVTGATIVRQRAHSRGKIIKLGQQSVDPIKRNGRIAQDELIGERRTEGRRNLRDAADHDAFVPAPEPANTGTVTPALASQPDKRCSRAIWPFFDNDCLWGNTADSETQERHRRRIVARLMSPWCSGLNSNDSAYFCRPRS